MVVFVQGSDDHDVKYEYLMFQSRFTYNYPDSYEHFIRLDQCEFLQDLWGFATGAYQESFGVFRFRHKGSGEEVDKFFKILEGGSAYSILRKYNRLEWDQFFCPNTFSKKHLMYRSMQDSGLSWCETDGKNPCDFTPKPSLVWQTSPERGAFGDRKRFAKAKLEPYRLLHFLREGIPEYPTFAAHGS